MSVYKRDGEETYSYDFWVKGTRYSGDTRATTKREAQRLEEKERTRIKNLPKNDGKPMAFAEATALYWDQVGQFLANADDELRSLAWLEDLIGRATLVSEIDEATVSRVVAKRRGERAIRIGRKGKRMKEDRLVSAATVNRTVTQPLRAILHRCADKWSQPVHKIDWKDHFLEEPVLVREASADVETKLRTATRSDYEPALRFAFLTGSRRAEIVGLEWTNVDFFTDTFTVTGKRGKTRTIPMTSTVRALLWSLKDHHPSAVFTYAVKRARDGRERGQRLPITINGFKTEWRRARQRAGVAGFRFHDSRHTAASRLVRATGNLKQAQKLLGHTELATTLRYAHVTDGDLRAGLEASNTAAEIAPAEATKKVQS